MTLTAHFGALRVSECSKLCVRFCICFARRDASVRCVLVLWVRVIVYTHYAIYIDNIVCRQSPIASNRWWECWECIVSSHHSAHNTRGWGVCVLAKTFIALSCVCVVPEMTFSPISHPNQLDRLCCRAVEFVCLWALQKVTDQPTIVGVQFKWCFVFAASGDFISSTFFRAIFHHMFLYMSPTKSLLAETSRESVARFCVWVGASRFRTHMCPASSPIWRSSFFCTSAGCTNCLAMDNFNAQMCFGGCHNHHGVAIAIISPFIMCTLLSNNHSKVSFNMRVWSLWDCLERSALLERL